MLYINNTTQGQTLAFPQLWPNFYGRDTLEAVSALYLVLTSTVGGQEYQLEVTLSNDTFLSASKSSIFVDLTLAELLPEGEYFYSFKLGPPYTMVMTQGLAIVGGYTPSTTTYDKTIEYEQYEG